MVLHLIRKVFHKAFDHEWSGCPEAARTNSFHCVANIGHFRLPFQEIAGTCFPCELFREPVCANATGKTFSAGLFGEEGHCAVCHSDHIPAVVENDDSARAEK